MNAYLLDELGWQQFEALCQAVLKAKLGLDVEAWGGQEADVPNWRDLLIEHLCANRNMRRQFLSR